MKCTMKLEDHISAFVRENAIMLVGIYTTVTLAFTPLSTEMKHLRLDFCHQGHCYS